MTSRGWSVIREDAAPSLRTEGIEEGDGFPQNARSCALAMPLRRVFATCLLLTACGGGESKLSAPEIPRTPTPPPGGGVLRTTLNVTVRPEPPDLLIVRTLGWPDAIPDATVVLHREGGANVTAQSNMHGVVSFVDLLEGSYQLTVSRAFSASELSKLTAEDRDYSAWGGAGTVSVGSGGSAMAVDLGAGAVRRGSLVFSEVLGSGRITLQPDGTRYNYSALIELYNNADTTITLDGMLIASTQSPGRNYSAERCAMSRDLYADTAGVWADIIYQLPPIGRRLKSGEMVLIALDAIDHRPFGSRDVYDLREADYEVYVGFGDVDNPVVPNLLSVGTVQAHSTYDDHGPPLPDVNNAITVASAQNAVTLTQRHNNEQNHDYLFIPRSTLLDVISTFVEDSRFPPLCAPAVGANIDAAPLLYAPPLINVSFQRSRFAGSSYLRRSRSSARDFSVTASTPIAIP